MDLRDQGGETHSDKFDMYAILDARRMGKRFNVLDIPQARDELERMPRWR